MSHDSKIVPTRRYIFKKAKKRKKFFRVRTSNAVKLFKEKKSAILMLFEVTKLAQQLLFLSLLRLGT